MKYLEVMGISLVIILICLFPNNTKVQAADIGENTALHKKRTLFLKEKMFKSQIQRFYPDSNYSFTYPDAVRGIYVTGHSAGGKRFDELVELIDKTKLNAMVIDIKDDWGNITYKTDTSFPYKIEGKYFIDDLDKLMKKMAKSNIYPIARIVVFKDTLLAKKHPEFSFKDGDQVWVNQGGEAFVNPFLKEVWDYNIKIAIEAAQMGFQEIQFDYVRFPEGFETRDQQLTYQLGDYGEDKKNSIQQRVQAITDFTEYARRKLKPYGVQISVDIFGYTATLPEAPGIGQNFSKISEHVDVISSMIYPSHWTSYFGIAKPDLEPYELVKEYIKLEKEKLNNLDHPPISRPWLQDFTASWLGEGNYLKYGKKEVEAQIRALQDEGVEEFLLWNAGNVYTKNVDYVPASSSTKKM